MDMVKIHCMMSSWIKYIALKDMNVGKGFVGSRVFDRRRSEINDSALYTCVKTSKINK